MHLGIDLGGTNIRAGLVDSGKIINHKAIACPSDQPQDIVLKSLIELIKALYVSEVETLGIGVPSVVDSENGVVYNVANIPSWNEVHLKSILQKEFSIPVFVNNDSNCFTLGEKLYGAAKEYKNVVGITLGTGVGAGIIVDGKLYNGMHTSAGEIGCLPYLDRDFESYCSSSFFVRGYGISGKEAAELANHNNPIALKIWNEFGHHLGHLMKSVLYTYDPQAIVLGGSIAQSFSFFSKAMFEEIKDFPYSNVVKDIKIIPSIEKYSSILGAASLG